MAVTFDANATAQTVLNAVTSITSSNLTVGAGSNRAVIAAVGLGWAVTAPTGVTANWDQLGTPVSMPSIVSADSTQPTRSSLFGLVNPVSGAKQLKVAWTNSADCVINATSFAGVDQTGGATSFPHSTSAAATSANPALSVTSATGNFTISTSSQDAQAYTATGNTQTFLDNSGTHISAAGERATGAASVSHSYTLISCPNVIVVTDILAAVAASFVPYQPAYNYAPGMAQ